NFALTGASSVTLLAGGTGNITQGTSPSAVTSPSIKLISFSGNIGSPSANFRTSSTTLEVATTGSSDIQNSGTLTLLPSLAGAGFRLQNTGAMTVNDVISLHGEIQLSNTSTFTVLSGARIQALNGQVLIHDSDDTTNILIGAGANI